MKTTSVPWVRAVLVTLLLLALAAWATAADSPTAQSKSYKGTVTAVDQKEKTFAVRGFWSTRTFHSSEHCKISLEDKPEAALQDLRPGYRVEVSYLDNNGVRVARQVAQKNLVFRGNIAAIDPQAHTVKVKRGFYTETFIAGDSCKVLFRDDPKSLSDLRIGHKVTVSYLGPGDAKLARRIEQSGATFTGTVEAIDADDRTLKAQHLLSEKKFILAKDCPIVLAGKAGGKMSDLRIGDKLSFQYEEMDGVLVATTITREAPPAASTPPGQVTKTQSSEP